MAKREGSAAQGKVLVVDDDVSTRVMVREVLEPAGFEVEEADGGRSGLAIFRSLQPDLVLLDVMMPDMDGFSTLELLRQMPGGASCPVVMVTGLNDATAINAAYERGATDFITKPINWPLLSHRVRYLLRGRGETPGSIAVPGEEQRAQRLARLGYWRWELESGCVSRTAEASRIAGLNADRTLKVKHVLAHVHRDDRSLLERHVRRALSAGRGFEVDLRVGLRGHRRRCVAIRAETRSGAGGSFVGLEGTIQDVTEQKEAENQRIRDASAETGRSANALASSVSRELRWTLRRISDRIEHLAQRDLDPESRREATAIAGGVDSALARLDAFLDLCRLEAGRLQLTKQPFSLRAVLDHATLEPARRARRRGVRLVRHVGTGVPDRLVGDAKRLEQVLGILVDNAVKFTDEGQVTIEVGVEADVEIGEGLRFSVRDSGIGLNADARSMVFEVVPDFDKETGLGLPLARRLVQLMGGTLEVESDVGTGSVFHLRVNFEAPRSGISDDQDCAPEPAAIG